MGRLTVTELSSPPLSLTGSGYQEENMIQDQNLEPRRVCGFSD